MTNLQLTSDSYQFDVTVDVLGRSYSLTLSNLRKGVKN